MRYPTVDYKVVPSAARQYLVSCVPGTGSLNETTSTYPVRMLHLRTHRIDKEVSPQASWACSRIYSRRYGIDGLLAMRVRWHALHTLLLQIAVGRR